MMFLPGLQARPRAVLRLLGLAVLVCWQFRCPQPPGLHGRGLAISVLLTASCLAWLVWTWRTFDAVEDQQRLPLSWELFVQAAAGGALVALSSGGPSNVFIFAAAMSAGARVGLPRGFLVTAVEIIAICIAWVVDGPGGLGWLAYALGLVAVTFGGTQRYDTLVRREQAELLLAQTQRSHEEQLRAAKLEESSRIAREIHDVLAHSLAGLTIQLEATAALIETGADRDTILTRVRRAHELARDGLRETRLAVGALRGEGAQAVAAASRIEALVGDFRASGGDISLTLSGERKRLTGPAADAAVRIVQEALTNVSKHAPDSAVTVSIDSGPPLHVSVENRYPAGVRAARSSLSASGGGYGIAGMRERAQELGGTLAAGPTDAGWLVEASLPAQREPNAPGDAGTRAAAGQEVPR